MKLKLLLSFIFITVCITRIAAQFDRIPLKTIYYYSGYSYRVKLNYKGDINKGDTLSKQKIDIFGIRLDTLINLSGINRKIIVFSNCIDSTLLNSKRIIVKGKIEDLPKDKYGVLNYSLYNKTIERDKATILYQTNKEIYTLTVPHSFFINFLRNQFLINKLDSAILNIAQDSSSISHQLLDNYVFFRGISLPIIPFVELNKSINKPDTDFEYQFYTYDSTIHVGGNEFFSNTNWYTYSTKLSNHDVGISEKFGIVGVDHENEEKGNISKGIFIQLIKVELPH